MDPRLAAALLEYRPRCPATSDGWLFPSPRTGRPFHQDTVCAKHLRPAGIGPIGWKTFRHSYRRWLDEAGTPLGIIKELMRNANISTAMDVYGVGGMSAVRRRAHSAVVAEVLDPVSTLPENGIGREQRSRRTESRAETQRAAISSRRRNSGSSRLSASRQGRADPRRAHPRSPAGQVRGMKRTYLDSSVLIALDQQTAPDVLRAAELLESSNRTFVLSPFVALEVLPGAQRSRRQEFLRQWEMLVNDFEYFGSDASDLGRIVNTALDVRLESPAIGAIDACHIAAAHLTACDELITAGGTGRPRLCSLPSASVRRASSDRLPHAAARASFLAAWRAPIRRTVPCSS